MVGIRLTRALKADLRQVANNWERVVTLIEYCSIGLAFQIGFNLTDVFARGKGIRPMTNDPTGLKREAVCSMYLGMIQEIVDRDGNETWYPNLIRMGFGDMEAAGVAITQYMKEQEVGGE